MKKRVGIVYRSETPAALHEAQRLAQWLATKGIDSYTDHEQPPVSGAKQISRERKELSLLDLVVVLGGDGTYLKAARLLRGHQKPILGVNLGSLGFLTETRLDELYDVILMALEGKMDTRPRSMLLATVVDPKSGQQEEQMALNDFVVERGASSHLIKIEISFDEKLVCDFFADGVIVATPTGSSAYNLAAGGPLLHPEVQAIVVTPISPHSLTLRPLVFPDDRRLTLRLTAPQRSAQLAVDGQVVKALCESHEIFIEKSKECHFILRKHGHNYFELLREKLKFGERT